GGLELSLACHYRVASPGAAIGLPEVKIGLIPGAGGTQRLPRVLGVETALNMIVTGDPVKSELLASLPGQKLLDKMIDGDLVAGAVAFAQGIADVRPLPSVRDLKVKHPNPDAYIQFARNMVKGMSKNYPAPIACVEAVAASLTTRNLDEGLAEELRIFRALMTMGGGITMNFLNAGVPVTMLEMKQEALDRGVATIRKNYEAQVKKGKLKQDKYEQRMALLTTTLSYDDLKNADLIIEAVFEEIGVKEAVFKKLDEVAKPGAILASNTSTLDVDKIATFTQRPQDVVGMHFFSPANVMKLLEVVRGAATAKD
ncbi:MAG: 3-hydroxyacyl-CoA dehydrogenase, partial [Burkholderiales bacterium PBB5]